MKDDTYDKLIKLLTDMQNNTEEEVLRIIWQFAKHLRK